MARDHQRTMNGAENAIVNEPPRGLITGTVIERQRQKADPRPFDGLHHRHRVGIRSGHRLLCGDMNSSLGTGDHILGMDMVRCGDENAVGLDLVEHVGAIMEDRRSRRGLLLRISHRFSLGRLRIQIANGNQLGPVAYRIDTREITLSRDVAATDNRYAYR